MDGGAGTVGHPQPRLVRLTGQQGTSSFRHPLAVAGPVAQNRRSCRCEAELDPTMVEHMSRHRSATPHHPAPAAPQPPAPEDSAENASTIAVVGATGAVGSPLVQALHNRSIAVAPISRSTGVDVRTGRGLEQALRGVDTVVDVSNVVTIRRRVAVDYFARATERLLRAAEGNRVQHYLVLSIVGIDEIDYGYYDGKRVQERLVRSSAIPHTIVRATQFHEFAAQMLDRMTFGPLALIPDMYAAPVAAGEVADVLADLAAAGPPTTRSSTPLEIAGPERLRLIEMVRRLQRRTGDRHLAVSVPLLGRAGWLMRHDGLLPRGLPYRRGSITFDQWLADLPLRGGEGSSRST